MAIHQIIAVALSVVFVCLSILHIYWGLGGRAWIDAAIPEIDGKPAFQPSALATFAVAIGLALCAAVVADAAGLFPMPLLRSAGRWLIRALSAVLFLRAIGDFRLVGFFKRARRTRFARLDTAVYSPLCLVLAIGCAYISVAVSAD